eukprot:scaffold16874_cov129-Cylindrotheca_fusiformis.AAC.1
MEECPPVYYQSALHRLIARVMSMRMAQPTVPILVHADDISSAFRRILYHPDMACAFGYVFDEFLLVPVGEVFGSRSAPSYYCVLADVRQALASILLPRPPESYHPLVNHCQIQIPSLRDEPLTLVPSESRYQGVPAEELTAMFNASFVDDNGVVAYAPTMRSAIDQSVRSAFLVFGESGVDRRGDCFQEDKWEEV